MQLQLIRHSTVKINVNNVIFLVDPMFSARGEMDPVANAANALRNPLVDLPVPVETILSDVNAILLTHSHRDHFDEKAISKIPKALPIFCQPVDEEKLVNLGFSNTVAVKEKDVWNEIEIIRTGGQHGTGELGKQMGPVSGFILRAASTGETLYVAGDTIWCKEVSEAIQTYSPQVIIVNGGEAQYLTGDPITMGIKDIEKVSAAAPSAEVVVVHMETWNHCLLTRDVLRTYISNSGIGNIKVPSDGETFYYEERISR